MAKELERTNPQDTTQTPSDEFVPLRLPSLITPFNIGDALLIQSINERHNKTPQSEPQKKK